MVLLGYSGLAPDKTLYSAESKAHLFWHDLFSSTVSADPVLYAMYGYNLPPFSDDLSYVAATHDLRGRNDGGLADRGGCRRCPRHRYLEEQRRL